MNGKTKQFFAGLVLIAIGLYFAYNFVSGYLWYRHVVQEDQQAEQFRQQEDNAELVDGLK